MIVINLSYLFSFTLLSRRKKEDLNFAKKLKINKFIKTNEKMCKYVMNLINFRYNNVLLFFSNFWTDRRTISDTL